MIHQIPTLTKEYLIAIDSELSPIMPKVSGYITIAKLKTNNRTLPKYPRA